MVLLWASPPGSRWIFHCYGGKFLPPSSGWLNLVQMDAEIIVEKKDCVGYMWSHFCRSELWKWEAKIELAQGQWMFRIPRIALVGSLLALECAVLGVQDSHQLGMSHFLSSHFHILYTSLYSNHLSIYLNQIHSPWRWCKCMPLKCQNIQPLPDAETQRMTRNSF